MHNLTILPMNEVELNFNKGKVIPTHEKMRSIDKDNNTMIAC